VAVYLPCYCTREDVKTASDILLTSDYDTHIDSAIQAAVPLVDGLLKRRFWNALETRYFDWPNFQYAYPWRIWFDEAELADVTVNVPTVTTGGQSIPDSAIFWGDPNYPTAPYTYMELDRSQDYAFGVGSTPQRDVAVTGLFGYWLKNRPAGSLAAAVSSTSATTITVTNSAEAGVGDMITIDSEGMLVSDRAYTDTGQAFSGLNEALASDNTLVVADGTQFGQGEDLLFDSEVCHISYIAGNTLTLIRAWDGSVLAAHTSGEIFAARLLTVLRGQFGTTAATHNNGAGITALLVPPEVRELAIGESQNLVAQKTSAWARALAEGTSAVPGVGLPDLRDRCLTQYGRKARQRVV
jgi:hypothetical protein